MTEGEASFVVHPGSRTFMPLDFSSFVDRHIGPRVADQDVMLSRLGFSSLDALMQSAVPAGIRDDVALDLPAARAEHQVLEDIRALADKNNPGISMIGLGYHPTITPGVIRRNVLEDPSWYTAYTPYQPEISQGRLEALLNFQTLVSELSGLQTANSSLLDEGTAAAEALTLMRRAVRSKTELRVVVDLGLLPQTLAVIRTRAAAINIEIDERDFAAGELAAVEGPIAGAIIAHQNTDGSVNDLTPLIAATHERGGLATVVSDPMALVLLASPGSLGADVVVGSTQRFGVPMFYGGPHAGFMVVREGL